jgi:fatty acid desaturase
VQTTLPIDELRRLSRVTNARSALDLVVTWGVIVGALVAAHQMDRWWAYAIAAVVIASRQCALANLAHDAWHGLCFIPRPVNNWVGAWLYAYPVGIPFHHDRRRHFAHHKRVGFHDDPDWINYSNADRENRARLIRFLTGRLLGSLLLSTIWSVFVRGRARIAVADASRDLSDRADWLRVAACQAVLAGAGTWWLGVWAYPLLWLLPLSTLAAFCTVVRAFVEHSTEDDDAPVEERLRDYAPGPIEAAWFSPCHFQFHALHHAYPSIPHYRLTAAKAAATAAAGRYPFAIAPGYLRSLAAHLRRLPDGEHSPRPS